MESSGMKRKYTDTNAITAKAETGSLRVKIMKKQRYMGAGASLNSLETSEHHLVNGFAHPNSSSPYHSPPQQDHHQQYAPQQQQPVQEPTADPSTPPSPPKPRPNRKHVPVFYQNPNALQLSSSKIMMNRVHSTSAPSPPQFHQQQQQQQQQQPQQSPFQPQYQPPQFQHQQTPQFPHQQFPLQQPGPNSNAAAVTLGQFAAAPITRDMLNEFSAHHHPGILFGHQHLPTNMPSLQQQLSNTLSSTSNSNTSSNTGSAPSLSHLRPPDDHAYSAPGTMRGNGAFQALQYAVDSHMASAALQRHQQHQGRRDQDRDRDNRGQEQDDSMMEDELGPPPTAPPSFAMENSLMGGGIEMQPVIANVNSRNFDWARRPPGMGIAPPPSHHDSMHHSAAAAAIASATTSAPSRSPSTASASAPATGSGPGLSSSSSFSGSSNMMMSDVETTRPRSNSFPNYLLEATTMASGNVHHNSQESSSFHSTGHASSFSAPAQQHEGCQEWRDI